MQMYRNERVLVFILLKAGRRITYPHNHYWCSQRIANLEVRTTSGGACEVLHIPGVETSLGLRSISIGRRSGPAPISRRCAYGGETSILICSSNFWNYT